MMKRTILASALLACAGLTAPASVIDFEDLTVPGNGLENGAGLGGAPNFSSGGALFSNSYDSTFDSWSGFAYSNQTDTTTAGFLNQYSAYVLHGPASSQFAVAYDSSPFGVKPVITLAAGEDAPLSIQVTNTTYTALSIRDGDSFSRRFGDISGTAPDYFKLTIEGRDINGTLQGSVDFYLADYRFSNSAQDYIVDSWQTVDLTPLGQGIHTLDFQFETTVSNSFGPLTPLYFAADNLTVAPEPGSAVLIGLSALGFGLRRRRVNSALS